MISRQSRYFLSQRLSLLLQLLLICCICLTGFCQTPMAYKSYSGDTTNKNVGFLKDSSSSFQIEKQTILKTVESMPTASIDYVDKKYSKLTDDIQNKSEKLLKKMQQEEGKLLKKLQKIDSIKAKELFEHSEAKYEELKTKITNPVDKTTTKLKEYIPGLDSINTMFKFLNQPNSNICGFSQGRLDAIQNGTDQLNELQGRLQQANEIQSFIRERAQQLKTALENTPIAKELLQVNKQVYYYEEQLREYKSMLHDPDKMEAKALQLLNKVPAFQKFMKENSMLASLFRTPENYGTVQALAGLQTRAQIQQQFTSSFSGTSGDPQQFVQQQMQVAQTQLQTLKDKLNQLGGGSTEMTMPDFKPDNQKTKTFLQRLEYGVNIQNQRSSFLLPTISDVALSLGYKLSDKKTIGFGASYKLGWGSGFNNIKFTSEGVGLRGYADIKFKGSIWITGGFEYNYFQHFSSFSEIKNLDIWQRSALAGVTKKYKIGKKREGNFQLLYDFLAYKQVPQAQALKFRMGWAF